jgi:cell division septum initiation protein DivIVA
VDLATRLQQLEELVREAKSMPLSSSALLNRDEVMDLIKDMREALPDEIRQARWVVKDREELLAKARRDADAAVDEGRAEQLRLATHEAVVQRAKEEAERLVREAGDEARRLRLEAEDYADAKLAQFEASLQRILEEMIATNGSLARTIDQVQAGRDKLRAGTPSTTAELTQEGLAESEVDIGMEPETGPGGGEEAE